MVHLGAHYSERQGLMDYKLLFKKQMLQAANTFLLNPFVPKALKIECQNLLFPLQIKPVKVS